MSNDYIIVIPKNSLTYFEKRFKFCLNELQTSLCDILGIESSNLVINSKIDKCLIFDSEDYELIRINIEIFSPYIYSLLKLYANK